MKTEPRSQKKGVKSQKKGEAVTSKKKPITIKIEKDSEAAEKLAKLAKSHKKGAAAAAAILRAKVAGAAAAESAEEGATETPTVVLRNRSAAGGTVSGTAPKEKCKKSVIPLNHYYLFPSSPLLSPFSIASLGEEFTVPIILASPSSASRSLASFFFLTVFKLF